MGRRKRTAIIGCGLISGNHLKALAQMPDAGIYAVCDIRPERAEKAARDYGIENVCLDYHELLHDPNIDMVHICTPHYLHGRMAVDSLEAGKHVLCEKPMSINTDEAILMQKAAKRSGKQLGVCFQNRYNEASKYLKSVMESGQLGTLLGARGQVAWNRGAEYYESSDWRGRWQTEGGGVLINQAIHTFDLLQWLAGEISRVEASFSTRRLKQVIEVEDTVEVFMEGLHGERFLFYATNCYVRNAPVELELFGTNGSLKLVGSQVFTELGGVRRNLDYSAGEVLGKDYWGSGHGLLIQDFYDCIETGRAFPIGANEAMASVRLLEAVYASGRSGQGVRL